METTMMNEFTVSQEVEAYCTAHPNTPSAMQRPRVMFSRGLCIAFVGINVQNGIVGFGPSLEAALRSFDQRYLAQFRPADAA